MSLSKLDFCNSTSGSVWVDSVAKSISGRMQTFREMWMRCALAKGKAR